ncbi:MAG: TOBE-like domain-containing protein [Actinobacteria bacterium]|nr:TOBE-like domain-containing protein [Actinomycetota bacterium]
MSFLGSVSRLGGHLVRPHDIVLERDRASAVEADASVPGSPGVIQATVERVVRLGFEVRVELRDEVGERFAAQMTRAEADRQRLAAGETIWARAARVADAPGADAPEPALAH